VRRERPDLFSGYERVEVLGAAAEHAVAFDRGGAITVATRLPVRLARAGGWGDTSLELAADHTDVLTGRRLGGEVSLGALLGTYPVALLAR
jgi:(1->4)-alpha-D-glucan 1-alpha-D-glucosylmutase